MNKQRFSPDDLRIASPCAVSWGSMTGDERKRLCALCDLHVYNVAAMTRAEVEALVRDADGRLCLRLYRRADGTVMTRDCPVGLRAARRRVARKAGAVLAALLGLTASVFGQTSKQKKDDKKSCPATTFKIEKKNAADNADQRGVFGGVITDIVGAVVPGVTVTLTNESTKQSLSTQTDDEGEFTFPFGVSGRYTVEVKFEGFQNLRAEHIELKPGEAWHAEVVLQPSNATEIVGIFLDIDPTPVKTREGTTTINVDALRGVKPRD